MLVVVVEGVEEDSESVPPVGTSKHLGVANCGHKTMHPRISYNCKLTNPCAVLHEGAKLSVFSTAKLTLKVLIKTITRLQVYTKAH